MPRKVGHSSPEKLHLSPETLAVLVALALVAGLLAAMAAGAGSAGSRLVGPDGCTADTWRNPVTGRTEAVGRSRVDAVGRPLCR